MVCYYELLHNKNYVPLKLFSQNVTELLGDHLIGRPHCQTIHLRMMYAVNSNKCTPHTDGRM